MGDILVSNLNEKINEDSKKEEPNNQKVLEEKKVPGKLNPPTFL